MKSKTISTWLENEHMEHCSDYEMIIHDIWLSQPSLMLLWQRAGRSNIWHVFDPSKKNEYIILDPEWLSDWELHMNV